MKHYIWNDEGLQDGAAGVLRIGDVGLKSLFETVMRLVGLQTCCVWIQSESAARAFAKAAKKERRFQVSAFADDLMATRLLVESPHEGEHWKVYFQFPTLVEEWGLENALPSAALTAIQYYEKLLDVDVIYKPSGTGVRAIRGYYAKIGKLDVIEHPASGVEPFETHQPQAVIWCRDLMPHEERARYIHAYDKRASYLHAADVALGIGDWEHVASPDLSPSRPGVWRLRFYAGTREPRGSDVALGRCRIPSIAGFEGWFYTPMVIALQKLGYSFMIEEGYFFNESRQVLKKWRENLMQGLNLSNGDDAWCQPLRRMIKSTYTRSIGLLGSKFFSADSLYRPDWRGQIVDEAAARMLFNIRRISDLGYERGQTLLPVAVYDDCLYYASDSPSPYFAAPILTTNDNLSAKYQHKGTFDLNDESRALLTKAPAVFAREIKRFQRGLEAVDIWHESGPFYSEGVKDES